jgi:hypothetical protein
MKLQNYRQCGARGAVWSWSCAVRCCEVHLLRFARKTFHVARPVAPLSSWTYNIMSIHAFGRSKGIANLGLALWPLAYPIDAIRRRAIVATAT